MDVARTYGNIGNVLERQGKLQEALESNQKALEIFRTSLGDSHVSSANTKYNMALIHRNQGENNQARILFREAAAVYAQVHGAEHSETIDALSQAK